MKSSEQKTKSKKPKKYDWPQRYMLTHLLVYLVIFLFLSGVPYFAAVRYFYLQTSKFVSNEINENLDKIQNEVLDDIVNSNLVSV